jgi:hypothetical protein
MLELRLDLRVWPTFANIGTHSTEFVAKLVQLLLKLARLLDELHVQERHDPLVQTPKVIERHSF